MSTPDPERTGGATREVVLIGAGHAHVQVLRGLARAPLPAVRVTLVVDDPIAVYSGMVPGLVAGQYRPRELEIDARPLAQRAGARLVAEAATGVDPRARRVLLTRGAPLGYDLASFDVGATVRGLDRPGVSERAIATRPIGRFVRELSELDDRARARPGRFRVAVVGGGAAGVELAFTLRTRLSLSAAGRNEVVLVHSEERVLGGAARRLVDRVERELRVRGIRQVGGVTVLAVEDGGLQLEQCGGVPCEEVVWATGAASHRLFDASGLPTDARGFVETGETLQVIGHDDLFAVGDCASMRAHPDTPKAGVHAVRQGPVLEANLRAALAGGALRRYRPQHDFLKLLNLGDGTALGEKWGIVAGGRWVMRLKDRIDRGFVRRFQVRSDP